MQVQSSQNLPNRKTYIVSNQQIGAMKTGLETSHVTNDTGIQNLSSWQQLDLDGTAFDYLQFILLNEALRNPHQPCYMCYYSKLPTLGKNHVRSIGHIYSVARTCLSTHSNSWVSAVQCLFCMSALFDKR